jgi:hypothetical protein
MIRKYKLDVTNARIRDAKRVIVPREGFRWVLGDKFVLAFEAEQSDGTSWSAWNFAAGDLFFIGIKLATDRAAVTYLASADTDEWNDVADWDLADPTGGKICCLLDLNTAELQALFATGDTYKAVVVEVKMVDAAGHETTLAQADAHIFQDICKGSEGDPQPGSPSYYTTGAADAIFAPREEDAARWRFRDGCWQAYCADDDTWRPIVLKLVAGVPALVPGDAVEE